MVRTELLILETVTGPAALDDIQDNLQSLWAAHSEVPERIRTRVALAVAEVGANIIEHAGRGAPVKLRMESGVLGDVVKVTFTDEGAEASVDLGAVAMPVGLAERGRGLAIAQSVLAELAYRRRGAVNEWVLVSEAFG